MEDKDIYGFIEQVDVKCSVICGEDSMLYRVYLPNGTIVDVTNIIGGLINIVYSNRERSVHLEEDEVSGQFSAYALKNNVSREGTELA